MKRIRAFVAANLPLEISSSLLKLQRQLRAKAKEGGYSLRWVPAANFHITLRFLGDIQPEIVSALGDLMADKIANRRGFDVETGCVEVLETQGRPRVLWVSVIDATDGPGGLGSLSEDFDLCFAELGFEPRLRPFHAHVTLGRFLNRSPQGASAFFRVDGLSPERFLIDEISLYQSVLQRQGAEYRVLGRFCLGRQLKALGSSTISGSGKGWEKVCWLSTSGVGCPNCCTSTVSHGLVRPASAATGSGESTVVDREND